jgi:Icc-related predicted phosphoesterase
VTIRIAAVGDVHLGADSAGSYRPHLAHLPEQADVLLLAGDLTRVGRLDEARAVAVEFSDVGVPVIAVLGNHDYECDEADAITDLLRANGITVLEGDAITLDTPGGRLGVAGSKGFGIGFPGAAGSEFGEAPMKAFAAYARETAGSLKRALLSLDDVDCKVALMHYAPVEDTLVGERLEIYPFMGSYLLGQAVDVGGANLAVHGHAHNGSEKGLTAAGVPVRNVARPVINAAYYLYYLAPT